MSPKFKTEILYSPMIKAKVELYIEEDRFEEFSKLICIIAKLGFANKILHHESKEILKDKTLNIII